MNALRTLDLDSSSVVLRRAKADDLPAIVDLIAADQLGAGRDGIKTPADLAAYQEAFRVIDADPAQILMVAECGPGQGSGGCGVWAWHCRDDAALLYPWP
jgi:hypothetical protein